MPQPAELIWARYDKPNKQQTYLLLFLGEHDNKTIALMADKVPNSEINTLRINLPQLRTMRIDGITKFIKQNMPISYKNGYKQFDKNKLTILRSYGIKQIEAQKEPTQQSPKPIPQ